MAFATLNSEVLEEFKKTLTSLLEEATLVVEIVKVKREQVTLKFMVVGKDQFPITEITQARLETGDRVNLADLVKFVNIRIS